MSVGGVAPENWGVLPERSLHDWDQRLALMIVGPLNIMQGLHLFITREAHGSRAAASFEDNGCDVLGHPGISLGTI